MIHRDAPLRALEQLHEHDGGEAFAAGTFRLDGGKLSSFRVALQGRRVSVRAIPSLRLIVDAPVRKVQLDQLALFDEDECGTGR